MEITIRPLTNGDLFKVIGMLSKISGAAGRELAGLISSRKTEPKGKNDADQQDEQLGIQLATVVFQACYEHVEHDLIDWFASLCNKTKDEYMELPPDTTIQIIDQLMGAEEATSFFTRALVLFKRIKPSGNQSTEK
jgi:peptide subunit release factor RF-3